MAGAQACCFALLGGIFLCLVSAQVPGFGGCPKPAVKKDFDLKSYMGVWYEIERYFPTFFELGGKCGQATYTLMKNKHVHVQNFGFNRWTRRNTSVEGEAYAPNVTVPAKLIVQFPVAGPFAKGNYWVLDTDYKTYAVVYSCSALDGLAHADVIWILGRKRTMDEKLVQKLRLKIEEAKLRVEYLKPVDQKDCFK